MQFKSSSWWYGGCCQIRAAKQKAQAVEVRRLNNYNPLSRGFHVGQSQVVEATAFLTRHRGFRRALQST